jgi:hypothetical protein
MAAGLPVFLLSLVLSAVAHKHHEQLTDEQANAPVDAILWIHMFLQATVWGVLFPVGMVLGITRSRWHVPLQVRNLRTQPISVFLIMGRLHASLPDSR